MSVHLTCFTGHLQSCLHVKLLKYYPSEHFKSNVKLVVMDQHLQHLNSLKFMQKVCMWRLQASCMLTLKRCDTCTNSLCTEIKAEPVQPSDRRGVNLLPHKRPHSLHTNMDGWRRALKNAYCFRCLKGSKAKMSFCADLHLKAAKLRRFRSKC